MRLEEKDCLKIAPSSLTFLSFKRFAVFQASRQNVPVSIRITDVEMRKLRVLASCFPVNFQTKAIVLDNTLLRFTELLFHRSFIDI